MIELDRIYNEDCLVGMKRIPDESVDAIICDPPFGTMKGFGQSVEEIGGHKHDWDVQLPTDELFAECKRVVKRNGAVVLFSQEPYTSQLRTYRIPNIEFLYPMIWEKDSTGNHLLVNHAPMNYFEDINVFRKKVALAGANPLRQYFARMIEFFGFPKTQVVKDLGTRAQHCFNTEGNQFALCTEETYADLISHYHIDQMEGFLPYEECRRIDREFKAAYTDPSPVVFNLPEGQNSLSNVLKFRKDTNTFHPTQKPVALLRRLVYTYTNEGDTVLDMCMGSGTTAIACIRERRHFIGFETDKEFYEKAIKRIENETKQTTLF